jgi:hypothetical protein
VKPQVKVGVPAFTKFGERDAWNLSYFVTTQAKRNGRKIGKKQTKDTTHFWEQR